MTAKADVWVGFRTYPHVQCFTSRRIRPRKLCKIAIARSTKFSGALLQPYPSYETTSRRTSRRVLRKGGIFVYLTFGQPHFRRRYLDRPGTTLEIRKLGEAFHYYLYIIRT